MKKIMLVSILCVSLLFEITGCVNKNSNNEKETDILEKNREIIFNIYAGNKVCVPVQLTVYDDGTYELFTTYETCRPGQDCNLMLKYTKSIKGEYKYDVDKIIENSINADGKSFAMDNLPEYQIYMGQSYVEQGYGYHYIIEKGQTNIYLDEFLKEIDVELNVCAKSEYID